MAFAVAVIIEAPVIMMLGASTALVDGRTSYLRLRRFTMALNGLTTLAMLVLVATPAYESIFQGWIGLDERVADLTHGALVILLPWPAAIGYRRFHQGLLIRSGSTRMVAYGTAVRLSSMTVTASVLFLASNLPGAWVGACALSIGVVITMLSRSASNRGPVLRFAASLGLATSVGLALIVATPLSRVWFQALSGLDTELYRFALLPAWILIPFPAMSVLLSLQRGLLMHSRKTTPITWATVAEVVAIASILTVLVVRLDVVGAVAAAAAFVGGRLIGNLLLMPSFRRSDSTEPMA